uniref:Uncharacterized protein n=1 Tax=Oryza brachyantha TaxID=4533 RepID=J3MIK1_ORYBR
MVRVPICCVNMIQLDLITAQSSRELSCWPPLSDQKFRSKQSAELQRRDKENGANCGEHMAVSVAEWMVARQESANSGIQSGQPLISFSIIEGRRTCRCRCSSSAVLQYYYWRAINATTRHCQCNLFLLGSR